MENKDLGSTKMNGKQEVNEGFSGKNMFNTANPNNSLLNEELEIDAHGNEKIVQRARNIEGVIPTIPDEVSTDQRENEGLSHGVSTEKQTQKTIENRDRNSDITPNRYPNSNPDNHKNRGNIKLDE